ncbi:MAG: PH domain-containing protein [Caldiserica bacterium]|nr:PH domain-containing protein [Caldisericota bacterium]
MIELTEEGRVFRPRVNAWTRVSTWLLAGVLTIPFISVMTAAHEAWSELWWTVLLMGVMAVGGIAVSTNTVRVVRTMRYILTADAVEIRAGGSSRRILFKDVVRVEVVNLAFNPISSYRLPGLALYDVLYSDEGIVTMFSTHALRDVVLIETADHHKYGISPEDEVEFVSDLRSRLQL